MSLIWLQRCSSELKRVWVFEPKEIQGRASPLFEFRCAIQGHRFDSGLRVARDLRLSILLLSVANDRTNYNHLLHQA